MNTGFPILDRLLETIPEEKRLTVLDVLADEDRSAEQMSRVLKSEGHPVSATTIRTFRRSRKAAE